MLDAGTTAGTGGSAHGNPGQPPDPPDAGAGLSDAATHPHDAASPGDAGGPLSFDDCQVEFASSQDSRCTVSESAAECTHEDTMLDGRLVVSQRPMGTPPAEGWPAVVVYQGSFVSPSVSWKADSSTGFGGLHQVKLQAMLLDQGFVVIAPEAEGGSWDTNFPSYDTSSDARFIPLLIERIKAGAFGAVNPQRLYATGISSGGYMTSRMAVSYAGTFRALAIQSASYATCSGPVCSVPDPLPSDHPPTLLLHGARDLTVPVGTAEAYKAQLDAQSIEAEMIVDPDVIHAWLKVAPETIACWFLTH